MSLPQNFAYHVFLDSSGIIRKAHVRREADCWIEFQIENEV
jgi:hypothetical protein